MKNTIFIAVLASFLTSHASAASPPDKAGSTITSSPEHAEIRVLEEQETAQGLEALAYSHAMQAYLFSYPLFILERERKKAERFNQSPETAHKAGWNRLKHNRTLANAETDMPYSPNNDTLYTSAALDLTQGPIILDMPEIKDRFAIVQVTNAYLENMPYNYSPRTNGGDAIRLGFVAPDWEGQLPEGVTEVRVDTDLAVLAIRIAIYGEEELPIVHAYQDRIALSVLPTGNDVSRAKLPPIPAAKKRKKYSDKFAYFRRAADLLTEFPPPPRHHAMNATLWRVGLEPGKPFDPDKLDPATRKGVERALKDGPKTIEYLRRNRGKRFPTGWDSGRYADNIVFDYAARAAIALVGLLGNDPEEAIYFYTYFDADGEALDGNKAYKIHFEPEDIPDIHPQGFWSITMYDGLTFRYTNNPIDRFSIGSKNNLTWNPDGSLDIWVQSTPPGPENQANWLPAPANRPFRVTFRIYAPEDHIVQSLYDLELALPPLTNTEEN